MQSEIETRILDINKEDFIKKLISLGAIDKGEEKLDEIIFHAADGSWEGKYKFVRLRQTKDKIKLTYKQNLEQTTESAQEIEFEISDLAKGVEFLNNIGLKIVRKLEKYRHTFQLGDVTIDLDTWPKIPPYAEVEGVSVEALQSFFGQLGLPWEQRFDGDAREVFKHYGYDLNKISLVTFDEFK